MTLDWLRGVVRVSLMALSLHPWVSVGARLMGKDNPFAPGLMIVWMLSAAGLAKALGRRPRRRIVHGLVHGVAFGIGFALWAGFHGVGPAAPVFGGSWQRIGTGADSVPAATVWFWALWWGGLWYWGMRVARERVGRQLAAAEFALGLLGWGFVLLFAYASEVATLDLLPSLFAYFLVGLAHQGLTAGPAAPDGEGEPSPRRIALPAIVVLLGMTGVMAYGILGALTGTRQLYQAGVDGAVAFVGPWLMALLRWLFARPQPVDRGEPDPVFLRARGGEAGALGGSGQLPSWLEVVLWIGLALAAAAALVAVGVGLWRLGKWLMGRAGVRAWDASGAGRGRWRVFLLDLFRSGKDAVLGRGRALVRALGRAGRRLGEGAAALAETVRPENMPALYRGFLRWGRVVGWPRRPWETPDEYGRRIGERLPPAASCAARITRDYTRFAYGPPGPRTSQLPREVRAAYRSLFHPALLVRGWWVKAQAVAGGKNVGEGKSVRGLLK